jgi:predicted nucleic acid-binding protein
VRLPLDNIVSVDRRVLDVNVLAIFLVKDHPGCKYVSAVVEDGLRGAYIPLVLDILPLRAYWVMTRKWGCSEKESAAAVEHFVKSYDTPRFLGLKKTTILEGFRLASDLKHDVFDCIYLAFALQEKASGIVTTDKDFEKLCGQVNLNYINPVPKEVLKHFNEQNK